MLLAKAEREDERKLLRQIRAELNAVVSFTKPPTDEELDSVIRAVEDRRPVIVGISEDHARYALQRGRNQLAYELGIGATKLPDLPGDQERQAVDQARVQADREIDLRIKQLQDMKEATANGRARAIRHMREVAGGNTSRALTYVNKNEAYFNTLVALHRPVRVAWVTALDERVRPRHAFQHGQIRIVGEAFSNGCRFPHDPLAPIEEVAGCRCRLKVVTRGAMASMDEEFLDRITFI